MHITAKQNCQRFFETYNSSFGEHGPETILEIGSQDVNGSLRPLAPETSMYIGVDFAEGNGVDIVLTDPYSIPVASESADVILCSSCFEHSELFWLTFLEALRILKPKGLFYLNVPSNGEFHRYPVDCWRFYPDSGRALVTWAKRNGINAALLESYTGELGIQTFNDYVAVFLKDEQYVSDFPRRILHQKMDFINGIQFGSDEVLNFQSFTQEQRKLQLIGMTLGNQVIAF